MKTESLAACVVVVTISSFGCGGGRPGPRVAPRVVGTTPPPVQTFKEAINDPGRVSSVVAALETAATIDINTSITARVEYIPATHGVSIVNGSAWSIGNSDGNPMTRSGDFGPWNSIALSKGLGASTLYVDVFTDIEAPQERVIDSDGTIHSINRSLAMLDDTNATISVSTGVSDLRGTYDGAAGAFGCFSPGNTRCRANNGNLRDGKWTFLPDRPEGAKDVKGISGVVFTGGFNPNRTAGTLDGEVGYFRCTSQSCDHSKSNGRLTSLSGDWIFVPTTREIVTESDSDYLAGGLWLIAPDDKSDVDGYSFGAFATGNDPFDQEVLTPLRGAATYRGNTMGMYADRTEGIAAGRFTGIVELIAEFDSAYSLGSIRGAAAGFRFDGEPVEGIMTLEETAIGSTNSGLFEGSLSGFSEGMTYTGRWSGRFFGNDEVSIKPSAVAGTIGGISEGSRITFVGMFGAYGSQP